MSDRMFTHARSSGPSAVSTAVATKILNDRKYNDADLVSKLVDENKKRRKRFAEIRTARQRAMDELGRMSGHLKDLKEKLDTVDKTLSSVEEDDSKPFSRAYDKLTKEREASDKKKQGGRTNIFVRPVSDDDEVDEVDDVDEVEDVDVGEQMAPSQVDADVQALLEKEAEKASDPAKKKFKTQTFLVVKPKDGSKPKVYQEISDYDGYELPISTTQQQQQQQQQAPAAAPPPPPPPQRPTTQPPPLPAPRSPSASNRKPNAAAAAKAKKPLPPPPKREPEKPKTPDDIYSEIPFIDDDDDDEDDEDYPRASKNDKSPTVDRRKIPFQAARQRLASAWANEAKEAWLARNSDEAAAEEQDPEYEEALAAAAGSVGDAEVIRVDLASPNFSNVRMTGESTLVPDAAFTGAVFEKRTEVFNPEDDDEVEQAVNAALQQHQQQQQQQAQQHQPRQHLVSESSTCSSPQQGISGVKWISLESRRREKIPHGDKHSTPERYLSVKKIEIEQTDTSYIATTEIKNASKEKEVVLDSCNDAFGDLEEQLEQCKSRLTRLKDLSFPPIDDFVYTRSPSFVLPTAPFAAPIIEDNTTLKRVDSLRSLTGLSISGRRASIAVEPASLSLSHGAGAGHSAMCCICRDIYSQGLHDIAAIQEKAKGSWVDLSPGMLYRPISRTFSVESLSNVELDALESELSACRDQLDKLKKMHLGAMTPVPEEGNPGAMTPEEEYMKPVTPVVVTPEPPQQHQRQQQQPAAKKPALKTVTTKPPEPQPKPAAHNHHHHHHHLPPANSPLPFAAAAAPAAVPAAAAAPVKTPFDYVGLFPPRARRASIVGAVIPYPTWPNNHHGRLYGYGLPMNGYITTNPLAPQSQQPYFTPYGEIAYPPEEEAFAAAAAAANAAAAATAAAAAAEKVSSPPPPAIVEEEEEAATAIVAAKPAAELPAPVKPATKDRRRGLTFWSLIV